MVESTKTMTLLSVINLSLCFAKKGSHIRIENPYKKRVQFIFLTHPQLFLMLVLSRTRVNSAYFQDFE